MGRTGREQRARPHPVRTCVGCRQRAAKTDLLRVVLYVDHAAVSVVPDPDGHRPGRGAYIHPISTCLELAERRRAFVRALRGPQELGPPDVGELEAYVKMREPGTPPGSDENTGSGSSGS